jgi:hypothetical protein
MSAAEAIGVSASIMEAAQAPESIKDRISIPFPSNRAERSESFAILRYRNADGARLTAG